MSPAKGWRGWLYKRVRRAYLRGTFEKRGATAAFARRNNVTRQRVSELIAQVQADEREKELEREKVT